MTNYKEILRLHSLGINNTRIAESCGCARSTVISTVQRAQEKGVAWEDIRLLGESEVARKLYPATFMGRQYKMPDYAYIHQEMQKSGVTLSLLWVEYCEQCRLSGELPYQSTQFNKLNDMHIPARKGEWSQTSVSNILTNEVYLGKIRWRREPVKRVVKEGMLSKKRILNDDYELYEGRHEAIITEEQWDQVQEILNRHKHTSNHTERQLKNPFAGVLYCEKCGGIMKRYVPRPKESPTAWFRCMTRNCDCKMIKCEVAEKNILNAMEEWLEEYQIQLEQTQTQTVDPIDTALETVHSQLAGLQLQQEKICEYLEKGIYSVEMFSKRNTALSKEIEQLRDSETDLLRQKREGNQRNRAATELIPATQHILDSYDALTVEEKNNLWKLVIRRATIYREPEGEVRIQIYPNLPR